MGGWGSGNIPDFSREAAAKSGKAPDGRRYGAGERGATYRLAPLPRGGAAFGHTSAEASAAALSRRRGRSPPSHSAASDHRLTSLSPGMSGSKDRKDWLPLCKDSPVGPPPAAADNGPYVDFDVCPTTSAPFYIRTASQDTTSWRTPALLQSRLTARLTTQHPHFCSVRRGQRGDPW